MKIDPNVIAAHTRPTKEVENPKLMKVAKQFEAILVNKLVSAMRKTIHRDGIFPESHAEKIYQSYLDNEHSQRIAESEQIGLARMLYDHLLQSQSRR